MNFNKFIIEFNKHYQVSKPTEESIWKASGDGLDIEINRDEDLITIRKLGTKTMYQSSIPCTGDEYDLLINRISIIELDYLI